MTSAPTPGKKSDLTNILLFGETGNGKSSLGNQLLGLDTFRVNSNFHLKQNLLLGKEEKEIMLIYL